MESNLARRVVTERNKRNYLKKQNNAGKFQIYFLISRYQFLEHSTFRHWNNKKNHDSVVSEFTRLKSNCHEPNAIAVFWTNCSTLLGVIWKSFSDVLSQLVNNWFIIVFTWKSDLVFSNSSILLKKYIGVLSGAILGISKHGAFCTFKYKHIPSLRIKWYFPGKLICSP